MTTCDLLPAPSSEPPAGSDHMRHDAQVVFVGGSSTCNGDQNRNDAHSRTVAGEGGGSDAATALVQLAAATLTDIESLRISTGNRLAAWDREGLPAGPERHRFDLVLGALEQVEHDAILELKRSLRKHPLGPWVKETIGVGEKQGARLIGAIGDPAWNHAESRPRRGPAELWAYCGLVPGQKKRCGERAAWNHEAKMRAFLIAESCVKLTGVGNKPVSPYRAVYDAARDSWAERDTSEGHKHNHALRVVAKELLKDLWKTSSRGAQA